jgi:hypothetical protein
VEKLTEVYEAFQAAPWAIGKITMFILVSAFVVGCIVLFVCGIVKLSSCIEKILFGKEKQMSV